MRKPTLAQALLMLIIAIIITTISISCSNSKHDWNEVFYRVSKGETLWNIAEEYCPKGMDIRVYMHEVKKLNNMKTSELDMGQTIILLTKGEN